VLLLVQGFSDPESIQKVVDSMKAAGADVELFMYDGSGHAFMNALTEKGRAKIKGGPTAACVEWACTLVLRCHVVSAT
jgi:dienelactone hydrolase